MSETVPSTSPSDVARPKRRGRTLAWVGGGAALTIAVAGFVVPQVVHAQRVSEYTELVAQRDDALVEQATAEVTLDAAAALTIAQQGELEKLGQRLSAVGTTTEPILTAEQTLSLTEAGNAVIAVVGEPAEEDDENAPASEPLIVAVDALRAADAAAQTAAGEAGEKSPEPVAPASYLSLDTMGAVTIIDDDATPQKTPAVADEDVTVELIEATAAQLASTQDEVTRIEGLIRAEEARMAEFSAVITDAVPVLRTVAETTATQATKVVKATPKAPDASATAVTAAQNVQEVADTEDATQILNGLVAYVDASKAAQTKHAAVVKKEKEAAEAAARAEAARKAAANRGGGDGGGERKKSRLCSRYRPAPGGGGSLVLVYC